MYCDFYCDFWQSVNAELSGGCGDGVSEGEECAQTRATLFGLQPAPRSFCADHARYALYSSCIVPVSKQQAFAEAVDALVQPAHDASLCEASVCPPTNTRGVPKSTLAEELHVEDSGVVPTPENAAPNPDGSPINFDCFESKLDGDVLHVLLAVAQASWCRARILERGDARMRAARALWSLVRALSVSSAVLTRLVLTRLAGL
eukprot:1929691-Rhodomonas_salina.1